MGVPVTAKHYAPAENATGIVDGVIVNADVNAAAAIAFSKLAALADGRILVGSAANVPTAVAVTGDVTITNAGATAIGAKKVVAAMLDDDCVGPDELADNAVVQAGIADDAVGAAELKVVVRAITVTNGNATATATQAADINGIVLGAYPLSGAESELKAVALTAASGKLDVTMGAAQAAGDVIVNVQILQV